MNILVLGHNGMLGHMVVKYLTDIGHSIHTITEIFPTSEFKDNLLKFDGDYIINCIGAIPQKVKIFNINYELPIWLELNSKIKIIHPGTDCEIDIDEYGQSKKQAREYIVSSGTHTKILKTSIIGPEISGGVSLLYWFLKNTSPIVNGYSYAMWSGITTLEWAKQCNNLMNNWAKYKTENVIQGECLSKFDLLITIKNIFNKNIEVIPNDSVKINKCLIGNIQTPPIETQLIELKQYYTL